jgi:hypothetical protein
MNRILVIAVLCLSLCSFGLAQQNIVDPPASKADVERYFEAVHVHEMMTQMVQSMMGPMHQMIHEQFERDKDKLPPNFEERMNKMLDDMMANMPWDDLIQAMIPAYEKHFTRSDMDALVAFYSTPSGQKILRKLPAVTAESMQTAMPIMQKYMEGMTDKIQQQMAEMLKESDKTQPPAPAKN